MEAGIPGTGTPNESAGSGATKGPRTKTTYAVYQATGDDVQKDQIASQLNLLATGISAYTELEARWAAVDQNPELLAVVNEGGELFMVAIPERRVGIRVTKLKRKVDERRV